jgi:hypothetical protein
MADVKGLKYFKVDYLVDIVSKNKSRLRGDVKKHVAKILKKLSGAMAEAEIDEGSKWLKYSDLLLAKSRAVEKFGPESKEVQKIDKEIKKEMNKLGIHESLINESKDIAFVLDQLANAVDLYPKDEFAKHMAKNTKYDEKSFEKLYDAYFKMKAMDRFHMATDISKSKRFLKKFGISETAQSVNEGMSDLDFVIDQISNSMEHYDEKDFVKDLSKETKYNANSLKKVFNAYWDMGAMERHKMSMNTNDTKKFLKKFGIKEEVQPINEGLWTGLKRRGDSKGINGKKGIWAEWGSGTSFQQILWRISPKKGFLDKDALDKDGKPEMDSYWTGWPGPGEVGLLRFFQHNEWEGLDIEKDFPYDDVNKMRIAYNKLPVKTKVQMAHGDHKLAMRFLAKFGIKP